MCFTVCDKGYFTGVWGYHVVINNRMFHVNIFSMVVSVIGPPCYWTCQQSSLEWSGLIHICFNHWVQNDEPCQFGMWQFTKKNCYLNRHVSIWSLFYHHIQMKKTITDLDKIRMQHNDRCGNFTLRYNPSHGIWLHCDKSHVTMNNFTIRLK